MLDLAANLRRLMAQQGLTIDQLARRAGVDDRTIKGVLNGSVHRPHARTLHKLAAGLRANVDELFQNPGQLAHRLFDRHTNSQIDEVVAVHPELFRNWSEADFDELYSHFGAGGQLTPEGTLAVVERMNRKRAVYDKVAVLLETSQAELLAQLVETLYRSVILAEPDGKAEGHFRLTSPAAAVEIKGNCCRRPTGGAAQVPAREGSAQDLRAAISLT
jgi:transcriptional regulator with XRE-family HTH domain